MGHLDVVDRLTEAKADLEAIGGCFSMEPQRLVKIERSKDIRFMGQSAFAVVLRLRVCGMQLHPWTSHPTREQQQHQSALAEPFDSLKI